MLIQLTNDDDDDEDDDDEDEENETDICKCWQATKWEPQELAKKEIEALSSFIKPHYGLNQALYIKIRLKTLYI